MGGKALKMEAAGSVYTTFLFMQKKFTGYT